MNPILAAILAAPLLVPVAAPAADREAPVTHIEVSPAQLAIPAGIRVRVVTVHNDGATPMSLRLTPKSWAQLPCGEAKLTTTDALVALPAALTLRPGESREVKILPTRPVAAIEQAFRVHIEELDASGQPLSEGSTSVPVFVQPPVARPAVVIASPLVAYQTASFSLANVGTSHFVTTKVEVAAFNAAGAQVFSTFLPSAFVLAEGSRVFRADLPDEVCGAASLAVFVDTPDGRLTTALGPLSCAR